MRGMKEHFKTVQNPIRMWSSNTHKEAATIDVLQVVTKLFRYFLLLFSMSQDCAVLRPEQDHRASARDLATCL